MIRTQQINHISLPHKLFLLSLLVCCTLSTSWAQISLRTDRPNAQYNSQEAMQFIIESPQSGPIDYCIKYDRFTPILAEGTLPHIAGQPTYLPYQHSQPGVVLCTIKQGGDSTKAAAAFSPYDIPVLEEAPLDFDLFWANQKAQLANIPLDPQLELHSENEYSTTYRLSLGHIDGRRVYAYLTIPDIEGPMPAFVTFPSFGDLPNIVDPSIPVAERAGALSLAISIHNAPVGQVDPNAYSPDVIDDPEGIYYRYALLAGVQAVNYLFTRSEFDGENLGVLGVSQGAGLALMMAGLDERVKLLACSNPSNCQHIGVKYGQPSGFPYYLFQSRITDGSSAHQEATIAATSYYDGVHFAKRYKGPSMFFISLEDQTTPPATQFAAYNQLIGPKIFMYSRDLKHDQNPDEYWAGRFDFFRRYFPSTLEAPWPWAPDTKGYFIEAGEDVLLDAAMNVSLNGQLLIEEEINPLQEVAWRLEEGPGNVSFSDPNNYASNASFSAPGTYLLSFSAFDDRLQAEAKYYRISDYLRVVVADQQGPILNLSTASTTVSGPFVVQIQTNEWISGLSVEDLDIVNGTGGLISGNDLNYALDIQPEQPGVVRLQIPAGQLTDLAGNANLASNVLEVNFLEEPLSTHQPATSLLRLFPNPAQKTIWLDWMEDRSTIQSLQLYDSQGNQLSDGLETAIQKPFSLAIDHLPDGCYWLVGQTSDGQHFQSRFLKLKP